MCDLSTIVNYLIYQIKFDYIYDKWCDLDARHKAVTEMTEPEISA